MIMKNHRLLQRIQAPSPYSGRFCQKFLQFTPDPGKTVSLAQLGPSPLCDSEPLAFQEDFSAPGSLRFSLPAG